MRARAKTELYDLGQYIVCSVYPGTRVMVGTPGAFSSYVTVTDPQPREPYGCRGTVENSRLSDTPTKHPSGEAELLTKAPPNFSNLVNAGKNTNGLFADIIWSYCRNKTQDCWNNQFSAIRYMEIWLQHPRWWENDEWLVTPRTDDRLNRCAIEPVAGYGCYQEMLGWTCIIVPAKFAMLSGGTQSASVLSGPSVSN